MKNKTQKSEKTITFYRKNFQPSPKRVMFFKNLQRERSHKTKPRILGRLPAYSLETLWGTLTDKLFREPLVLQCSLCKWRTKRKKVKKPLRFIGKSFNHCLNRYCFAKNSNENAPIKPSHGSGVRIWNTRAWMSDEEPLQTSCLGKKHWFYCVFVPK